MYLFVKDAGMYNGSWQAWKAMKMKKEYYLFILDQDGWRLVSAIGAFWCVIKPGKLDIGV